MQPEKPKIKKRKYSRNGCRECKRRRQKCDEIKPECYQCTRLKKVCRYDLSRPIQFENLLYSLAIAKDYKKTKQGSVIPQKTDINSSIGVESNPVIPHTNNFTPQMEYPITPLQLLLDIGNDIVDFDSQEIRALLEDASSLVTNMNDLASHELTFDDLSIPEVSNISQNLHEGFAPNMLSKAINNRKLTNEVIDKYDLQPADRELLLAISVSPLSYLLYPFASTVESNHTVSILLQHLKNCLYLLYAILAISATFQVNMGNKSLEVVSRTHISTCLKLLSIVFADKDGERKSGIATRVMNEIEGLLLTVLILTTNFAASHNTNKLNILDSWRAHLRGAKDLLLNYTLKIKRHNISPGLALAKLWYFAIEVTAGLNSPSGGSLVQIRNHPKSSDEHSSEDFNDILLFLDTGFFDQDSNPEYYRILVDSQFVTTGPRPFNLFLGCTIEYVRAAEELIGAITYLRENPDQHLSMKQVAKITSLIHESMQVVVIPGVELSTFEIQEASKLKIPAATAISDGKMYSWFDLTQQVHTNLLYLKLLTTPGIVGLPKSHNLVRQVVKTTIDSLIMVKKRHTDGGWYLDRNIFDSRAMMIHSPIVLCIEFINNLDDLDKADVFFEGLMDLGTGSAMAARQRLQIHRANLQQCDFDDIPFQKLEGETLPFA